MSSPLSALLAPRSVAIVGASDNMARIGGRPLRYMREAGYDGRILPVNPNRDTVQGIPAYASIAALPETPDVALLAVPAEATVQAVRDAAQLGVKNAIIFSAGFAETGDPGRILQDEISQIARKSGMRILGPNCLGVFNPASNFYGTFSVVLDNEFIKPGPVGIVSQSGAYGAHIAHLARNRGLGISHWITTGNEADLNLAEVLHWMVDQPETKVIMAYAESIRDHELFFAALEHARRNEKAIVFMKTGRSDVGAAAAASHTAALAGSDAVFDAVLRQFGVFRAASTAEQLDVAYACARGIYPRGNKIGIFTMSGGFGIQMADDAVANGLDVAIMPEDAQEELKAMLPYASPRNPVDATAQVVTDLPLMAKYINAVVDKGGYDIFVGIFGTGPGSSSFAEPLRKTLLEATKGYEEKVLALTMSAGPDVFRRYEANGFIAHEDGSALIRALGALTRFRRSFDEAQETAPVAPGEKISIEASALSERGAKDVLSRAGLTFPQERLVAPGGDIGAAAGEIGFPVVLKISSPDIAHKTEVGGVAVNIRTAEEANRMGAEILAKAVEKCPSAYLEGIVVAPMISGGVETIIGVVQDPVLGPVVMFGLGGIFVEVLKDVTFRAAPFDVAEAHRMIREIRGYAILEGVRGEEPADIDALAELLSNLSRFAAANADRIESIDLNPVRILPKGQGVVPLDALLILRQGGQ
ncbi:acetate--CoA ligase family protein [Microvirga lupini]